MTAELRNHDLPDTGSGLAHRVSIVLLTHNCAHRIEPILHHLLDLNLPLIAVDNGSADETADILARYSAADVVRLPRNIGAAARNAGADRAHTPYILFCDDDGWFEPDALERMCDLLDEHPSLAVINARILVGARRDLDPISAVMAASPLPDEDGIPGAVLLGFMAGAVLVRASAYKEVGGYDERFFIGGEEETLAFKLAKAGWHLRYLDDFVVHHEASMENAGRLRAFVMRNTIVNAWLHRPWRSALRWTAFVLADAPKNRDFVRACLLALRAVPWVLREREPMNPAVDAKLRELDRSRFASRRPLLNRRDWRPEDMVAD